MTIVTRRISFIEIEYLVGFFQGFLRWKLPVSRFWGPWNSNKRPGCTTEDKITIAKPILAFTLNSIDVIGVLSYVPSQKDSTTAVSMYRSTYVYFHSLLDYLCLRRSLDRQSWYRQNYGLIYSQYHYLL